MMRKRLTDDEYNAISEYTRSSHLDEEFDVCEISPTEDGFIDLETDSKVDLQTGLNWLYDGMAYPPQVEGLTKEQGILLYNLMVEFEVVEADETLYEWFTA